MKIFHGSLEIIEHPKILHPNRKLDYGEGFYTTTSEKQAEEWVKRRMFEQHANAGYINVYEFDDTAMSMLKTLIFSEPSREWVKFVMANRTKRGFTHDYDIVYGPVANDKVFCSSGCMNQEL